MTYLTELFEAPALFLHLVLVALLAVLAVVLVRGRRRRLAEWPRILRQSDRERGGWKIRLTMSVVGLAAAMS
jgi:hypothetical protein